MSSKQFLIDAATRHQVFLQRYAGGQSKEALKVLMQMRRTINARLMQEPTEFQRARLVAVLTDIESIAVDGFQQITNKVTYGAQQLAVSEAGFSVAMFDKGSTIAAGFTLPSDGALVAAVMTSQMKVNINSAITLSDALGDFSKKKTAQILRVITDGVSLGDTTPKIARELGTIINTLTTQQLNTLTRTITNHSAAVARDVVYEENADIIDGYEWVSTLDNRTTLICGTRDGVVYKGVTGDPKPPAHWGCRSTTIPKIKPEYDLGAGYKGVRPVKGKKPVSGNTTYGGWLKRQPKEFIDEALGIERSRLFRSGKLALAKFVDPTGRVYTLAELERMNPFAFME